MRGLSVETKPLTKLLNHTHLGGIINECVLTIKNGIGIIQSIDNSNCLFLSCSEELENMSDMELGISDLSILAKFFNDYTDESIGFQVTRDKKQLIFKPKRGGLLKLLLLDIELVPTHIKEPDAKDEMLSNHSFSLDFNKDIAEDYLYYSNLLKNESSLIEVVGGKVSLSSGKNEINQFNLPLGKIDSDDFCTEIYKEHLVAIVQNLKWDEENKPEILFGNETPVIIRQDENNIWALTPAMEV
jgi:hypothetical protein